MNPHPDPRERRRHRAPEVDPLVAAVRLDASLQTMRAEQLAGRPERPDDEPPTGLIDLNAIRALLGQPTTAPADPAAVAWLAGGADPDAARLIRRVDRLTPSPEPEPESFADWLDRALEPEPVVEPDERTDEPTNEPEPCAVLPGAVHAAPCGPQHTAAPLDPCSCPADAVTGRRGLDHACPTHGGPVDPVPCQQVPAFSSDPGRPALTWRSRHDPRSLGFGVRRTLPAALPVTDRLWPVGPVGDQGSEGACVGWGIVDAVNARAAGDTDLTAADAAALYARAQQLDDEPGSDYTGTSVLAGLQAAQERGWIGGYRWCFGTRDIAQAVLQRGPVVVGVPWLSGMYDTGPGGLVTLAGEDTGAGHCLAVVGITVRGPQGQLGPYFVWQNSWGTTYGDRGLGFVHHRDLATLLHGVGEAALPTPEAQQ